VSDVVTRVVLIGPSHHVHFRGLAMSRCDGFVTPLGTVPVDPESLCALVDVPAVQVNEAAHEPEHGLEVHLPFLQRTLRRFGIVPLLAGEVDPVEMADIILRLWGGSETVIVISSDLSHYYDYDTARRLDEETSTAIEQLAPERIGPEQACGRIPIQGALIAAKKHRLTARRLDVRNSGDTGGPRDRVVGYGAYVIA